MVAIYLPGKSIGELIMASKINTLLCLIFIGLSAYYDNWFIMLAYIVGQLYIAIITSDYERPNKNNSK